MMRRWEDGVARIQLGSAVVSISMYMLRTTRQMCAMRSAQVLPVIMRGNIASLLALIRVNASVGP